jgi:hypothetical protein
MVAERKHEVSNSIPNVQIGVTSQQPDKRGRATFVERLASATKEK